MPDEAATPGLFRRLKDRRIVQWAIAYVAAAWVLLQVAELLFGIFAWPDVWLRRLTVALVFGFVAAVVLAWYHGEKGQQRASKVELALLAAIAAAAIFVFSTRDFATSDEMSASVAKNLFEGRPSRRIAANMDSKRDR